MSGLVPETSTSLLLTTSTMRKNNSKYEENLKSEQTLQLCNSFDTPVKKKNKFYSYFTFEYFIVLNKYFGTKFLIFLVDVYFILRGLTEGTIRDAQFPFYVKDMEWDSLTLQNASVLVRVPWSIKGPMGVISDTFPLFGYHKRSYMFFYTALSLAAALTLVIVPLGVLKNYASGVAIAWMLLYFAPAGIDILCEGKYTQVMMENPETKANIVTYVWFFQYLGKLTVGAYLGTVVEYYGAVPLLWSIVVFTGQIIVLIAFNFVCEEPVPKNQRNKFLVAKFLEKKEFMSIGIFMGIALVVIAVVSSSVKSTVINLSLQSVVAITMIVLGYLFMPKRIAHLNTYMFLHNAFYPSLDKPLEYWYTRPPSCVPDGPNFTLQFHQTTRLLIGYTCGIIGIVLYQTLLVTWRFRHVYWISTGLLCFSHLSDYIIVKRWNLRYLGIPDNVAFLLGDCVLQNLVEMFNYLPGTILLSRVCPKSIEATTFAILAGFANYGHLVRLSIGTIIQEQLNINLSVKEACSYDNLANAILLCTVVVPLCSVVITFLLPSTRAIDPINPEELELRQSLLARTKKKFFTRKDEDTIQSIETLKGGKSIDPSKQYEVMVPVDGTSLDEKGKGV